MKRRTRFSNELCAYISITFFFIAKYDEDEEVLTKPPHLARLSLDAHHTYPSPTWFEPPSDRQTHMDGLLREIVRTLYPELANDTDTMNLLAW